MSDEPIHNLETVDSKFRFVHVAARRARQLMGGARPMAPMHSRKPTRIAQEEVLGGMIQYEYAVPPSKSGEEKDKE